MQLFYNANVNPEDTEIRFSKDESRHIVKVLRKVVGNTLHITNGKGWLFLAEISLAEAKNCIAMITHAELQPKRPYHLHLAVAPTKMNDRYEWFLEKATEIGIDSITPIICDNSERRVIKTERYEKILQSAMKQSLGCYLPQLNEVCSFTDFMEQNIEGQKFIAHCAEDSNRHTLKGQLKTSENTTIIIGPEGDFSKKEIELALAKGYVPVSLGTSRLRTETAAIVACHSVSFFNDL